MNINIDIKKLLKLTLKMVLFAVIGLAIIGIGIRIAVCWDDHNGRMYWRDFKLSENVTVRAFNDGKFRVWNKEKKAYVTKKLDWVSGTPPVRDSITVFSRDGRRGYLNVNTGRITLPPQYKKAFHFSEQRAFVVLRESGDSISVIDYSGKVLVRNIAPFISGREYVFKDGLCEIYKDGKVGLLALDGTWTVEPSYFWIEDENTFRVRRLRDEKGFWLIDSNFRKIFPVPYENIQYALGRENGTVYRTKDHVKSLVNYDGSVVQEFVVDSVQDLRYRVGVDEEGDDVYAIDPQLAVYAVDDWVGIMDKKNARIITKAIYTDVEMISPDRLLGRLSFDCESAVLLDRNGRVVKQ